MAVENIWKIRGIELPGPVRIGAITQVAMPVNASVTREVTAGDIFASSGRIDFTSVDLQITTLQAALLLDEIAITGACISTPYTVYVSKYECSGPILSNTAVHRSYTVNKGMLFLNSLSCDHKGDVTIQATLQAVFDGTNDPVIASDVATLPAFPNESDRWTLAGPECLLMGVPWEDKTSVNIDFGVTTSTTGADSDPYDTFASIDSVLPVVTVNGINPTWYTGTGGFKLGAYGGVTEHDDTNAKETKLVFRKRDGAGGFVPDATAEHIEITMYGPAYHDQLLSASGVEAAQSSIRIEPIKDPGGNAPLLIDVAYQMAGA